MPCPVFARGETMVMQRGAGICTVKSTPEKEKACITFLKVADGGPKECGICDQSWIYAG